MSNTHNPIRIAELDTVRAFAFLAVFLHHAMHWPLLWLGVDLFFVLSGFLITRNLLTTKAAAENAADNSRSPSTPPRSFGSNLREFVLRRAVRIIPPYWIALACVALTSGIASEKIPWLLTFTNNIYDAFVRPMDDALGTFWSIAVEEQFYLVWPFLVLLAPKKWLPWLFAFAIIAATALRAMHTQTGLAAVYRLTWCRMDLLAAGAMLAVIPHAVLQRRRVWFWGTAIGAVVVFVALSKLAPTFRTSLNSRIFNVCGFALSTVFFTSSLAIVVSGGATFLRSRWLGEIGKVSYMAYLVHMLALQWTTAISSRVLHAIAALVVTLAIAALSWVVVEKPLARWLRARLAQPTV
jgi:peptidoglycan/LPS O-acetylase OafA/YrhL